MLRIHFGVDGPADKRSPLLGLLGQIALKKFVDCLLEKVGPALKMYLLERHVQVFFSDVGGVARL